MPRSRNPYAQPAASAGVEEVAETLLQQRLLNRCRELDLFAIHIPKVKNPRGRGWRTPYHPLSRGNGFPDTFIVGTSGLFVELKVGDNTLEPDQREWMARLRFAGLAFVVWTERHWSTGIVEETLCKLGGPKARPGYCIDGFTPSNEFGPDMVVSSGLAARLARSGAA